ncbi:MAG: hypothetical protein AAF690_25080 [Acidobacteriota bacterium]
MTRPRRRAIALRGSLTALALLPALGCSRAAADDPGLWVGRYGGTRFAVHTLELRPDGTYRSVIWQQLVTASGCGGPFVGDGVSEGAWSTGLRRVAFEVEGQTNQFGAPLEGARLVSEDGTFRLHLADGEVLPMAWSGR